MPEVEPDITADELDKEVLEELRSLPGDLADLVGRHLVAAERALEDDDPDRAHEHTKVARRFAARIGVVREAAGIVAYRAGHFSEALSDLRAARRMTGSDVYLAVIADCERGLGRPERAIDLVRSPEAERLDRAGRIELTIVESGARRDLGQHDAAVITLQRLPELRDPQPKPWSARLAFAYADALADAGHQEAATDWFGRAMAFDEDGETDAAERYAELTGSVIEDLEEDFDDDASDTDDLTTGDLLGMEADEGRVVDVPERADVPDDQGSGSQDAAEPQQASVGVHGGDVQDADVQDVEVRKADVADPEDPDAGARVVEAQDTDGADTEVPTESPQVPDEDPRVQAEKPGVPDEQPAVRHHEAEQDERTQDRAADRPDAPEAKEHGETPGITPAFIEPDFGDALGEPTADRPKTDD
ncbi:hypothetical protein FE391_43835 [Nonomuraea sp. KC401]|uniref:hypothetical protein n=1 Tax=unclassified Nonomuraea TaxID=2593643 RepID=UPI0010FF3A9C|nr:MULTISPECIES: hypothetical protein [unclassified Nonomuraea]NBE99334.1 hypothetical protein [Nonomuraea sp. K271]TLF52172.1 hypothetical protein FE391_43835 [Nonomuraea sp. KC401]